MLNLNLKNLNKLSNLNNLKNLKNLSKNFLKAQKYNMLTIRTRRDRANQGLANPNIFVDDVTYYKQMKEFIKETQGVPRNSVKWNELKNKHYAILRKIYSEQQFDEFKETQDYSFVRFYLIVLPENIESYEMVSILNFYNIKFKAVRIFLVFLFFLCWKFLFNFFFLKIKKLINPFIYYIFNISLRILQLLK